MCCVRPSIERVIIINRTILNAEKLKAELLQTFPKLKIVVASDPKIVKEADIVVTATNSPTPLFSGFDLSPGTHINGIGSYT